MVLNAVFNKEILSISIGAFFNNSNLMLENTEDGSEALLSFSIKKTLESWKLFAKTFSYQYDNASRYSETVLSNELIAEYFLQNKKSVVFDEKFDEIKPFLSDRKFVFASAADEFLFRIIMDSQVKSGIFAIRDMKKHNNEAGLFFKFKNLLKGTDESIERILASFGEDFLVSNLSKSEFDFDQNSKKLKNSLGISQAAMDYLRDFDNPTAFESLKQISQARDGSDVKYLVDFIRTIEAKKDLAALITNSNINTRSAIVLDFLGSISFLCNKTTLSIKKMLSYAWIQEFYYGGGFHASAAATFSKSLYTYAEKTLATWSDCITMAEANHLIPDILPQNIYEEHFYLASLKQYNEPKVSKAFDKAVAAYKHLEVSMEKHKNKDFRDYCFVCPKNVKDMIEEGAAMRNCMAFYIDKVIDGSIVLFIRKVSNPDKPLMAIEVDWDGGVKQVKGIYDHDVEDVTVLNMVMCWAEEAQERKIKYGKI